MVKFSLAIFFTNLLLSLEHGVYNLYLPFVATVSIVNRILWAARGITLSTCLSVCVCVRPYVREHGPGVLAEAKEWLAAGF